MTKEFSKEEKKFLETHKHYGEIVVEMLPATKECEECDIMCAVGSHAGMYTEVGIFNINPKDIKGGIEKGIRDSGGCKAFTSQATLKDVSTIVSFEGGDGYKRLFSSLFILTEESIQEIEAKITGKKSPKAVEAEEIKIAKDLRRYSKYDFLERIHKLIRRENEKGAKGRNMRES